MLSLSGCHRFTRLHELRVFGTFDPLPTHQRARGTREILHTWCKIQYGSERRLRRLQLKAVGANVNIFPVTVPSMYGFTPFPDVSSVSS